MEGNMLMVEMSGAPGSGGTRPVERQKERSVNDKEESVFAIILTKHTHAELKQARARETAEDAPGRDMPGVGTSRMLVRSSNARAAAEEESSQSNAKEMIPLGGNGA